MDDELKAIQNDLDNVLNRLGEYMASSVKADEPQPQNHELAGSVIYQYVCGRKPHRLRLYSDLEEAAKDVVLIKARRRERLQCLVNEHGEDKGHVLAALDELAGCYADGYQALEPLHVEMLGFAAFAYMNKTSRYFGQEFGLPLHSKREVDSKAEKRFSAAFDVWKRNRRDPKKYPISEGLFELAGQPYGMSASVVKRAYYSPEVQRELKQLGGLLKRT